MDAHPLTAEQLKDLEIERLGEPGIDSPLLGSDYKFVEDGQSVLIFSSNKDIPDNCRKMPAFELAGPRKKIYFDPAELNCGIVTCGGLCPGLNDVIRTITLTLTWQYRVNKVYGFRYGYAGMTSEPPAEPFIMTPELVDEIHLRGGDILSSSRGPQSMDDIVNNLEKRDIKLVFAIGGDGTMQGVNDLTAKIKERGLDIAIIGVPKTIDNDILGIEKSFGFSTAVEASRNAILAAHDEAKGAYNGIGLVRLMGRDSGFIAAYATLANSDVNYCFIPEVPLKLEGPEGFLHHLEKRLSRKHHAVIVIAEGVRLSDEDQLSFTDESGNVKYEDIGKILENRIYDHFGEKKMPVHVKYIDPSYMIRGITANSDDSAFCLFLGQQAVHAGMSGRTNMLVGYWNQYFTHIPTSLATQKRKRIDPAGHVWQTILHTTGQTQKTQRGE